MLLAGVAIAAIRRRYWLELHIADDQMLRDSSLWSMGSLAGAKWSGILLAAVTPLVGLFVIFYRQAMSLNALLLGGVRSTSILVSQYRSLSDDWFYRRPQALALRLAHLAWLASSALLYPSFRSHRLAQINEFSCSLSGIRCITINSCRHKVHAWYLHQQSYQCGIVTAIIGAHSSCTFYFNRKENP